MAAIHLPRMYGIWLRLLAFTLELNTPCKYGNASYNPVPTDATLSVDVYVPRVLAALFKLPSS